MSGVLKIRDPDNLSEFIEVPFLKGDKGDNTTATAVTYDNTTSGLTSTNVQGAIDEVVLKDCARAFNNANVSTTSPVVLVMPLNSEVFDTNSMHDNVTNNSRITVKKTGIYIVNATVQFAANISNQRFIRLLKNGAEIATQSTQALSGGTTTRLAISCVINAVPNDYFELAVFQNSGGNLNVEYVANMSPYLTVAKII